MDGGTIVTPGNKRRVQVRKARKDGFTEAKKRIVLDHLAGCANMTRAAAAGVGVTTVSMRRQRHPLFAFALPARKRLPRVSV